MAIELENEHGRIWLKHLCSMLSILDLNITNIMLGFWFVRKTLIAVKKVLSIPILLVVGACLSAACACAYLEHTELVFKAHHHHQSFIVCGVLGTICAVIASTSLTFRNLDTYFWRCMVDGFDLIRKIIGAAIVLAMVVVGQIYFPKVSNSSVMVLIFCSFLSFSLVMFFKPKHDFGLFNLTLTQTITRALKVSMSCGGLAFLGASMFLFLCHLCNEEIFEETSHSDSDSDFDDDTPIASSVTTYPPSDFTARMCLFCSVISFVVWVVCFNFLHFFKFSRVQLIFRLTISILILGTVIGGGYVIRKEIHRSLAKKYGLFGKWIGSTSLISLLFMFHLLTENSIYTVGLFISSCFIVLLNTQIYRPCTDFGLYSLMVNQTFKRVLMAWKPSFLVVYFAYIGCLSLLILRLFLEERMMHESSPDNNLLGIRIHPPTPLTEYYDTCEEIPEISMTDRTENANVEVETLVGDRTQGCDVASEIQEVE